MLSPRSCSFLAAALSCGVGCSDYEGPPSPADALHFPVAVIVHPNGQYAYVSNSNFDLQYRERDGGTVAVVDTASMTVIGETTVHLGSFTAGLAFGGPDPSAPSRLYVAVRGDDSVVVLDIAPGGRSISCPFGEGLACRVRNLHPDNDAVHGQLVVGNDPFALAVVDPEQVGAGDTTEIVAVVTLGGTLAYAPILREPSGWTVEQPVHGAGVGVLATVVRPDPSTAQLWVAGRGSRYARAVEHARSTTGLPYIIGSAVTALTPLPMSTDSAEVRDLAFSPARPAAYITTSSPGAVYVLNLEMTVDGRHRAVVARRIDVDGAPGQLVVRDEDGRDVLYVARSRNPRWIPGAPGSGDDLFASVAVIDAGSGAEIASVALDAPAYGLALDAAGTTLYATQFDEARLVRIDVDPDSPTFRMAVGSTP